MQPFSFTRISDAGHAVKAAAHASTAQQGAEVRFVTGGTTLIDLMKINVEVPQHVVDINHLPLAKIEGRDDGKL